MLKSTHKASDALPALPTGWSEHKAPTGHSYYYNSVSKESTYTRPSAVPQQSFQAPVKPESVSLYAIGPENGFISRHEDAGPPPDQQFPAQRERHGNSTASSDKRRFRHRDRPKTKDDIPACAPWVLVKTTLGRRFVHNPETGESYWRFPTHVMKAVVEYDKTIRQIKAETEATDKTAEGLDTRSSVPFTRADDLPSSNAGIVDKPMLDSDGEEYEEIEVTDDESAEDHPPKRLRGHEGEDDKPVDFDEDDIAYQLAAMGEEYGLDPEEYGGGDIEDGNDAEGLPLTEEDSKALFKDMLDDLRIDPYTTWDTLIGNGLIIEDDRYTVLTNMRSRKDVWDEWSRDKIKSLKEERLKAEKKDPRLPYFAFLESKGTPKLYWPEFRRKYQKEPEMRNTKISDKDRERWYRDFINRLKLPENKLKADLVTLLKDTPLKFLNRASTLDSLPSNLLTDLRFISLRSSIRGPLIEAHIGSLPDMPKDTNTSPADEAARSQAKEDRRRREQALADRQRQVEEDKKKLRGTIEVSRRRLREEEEEVERAMTIGKDGLRSHMQ